MMYAVVSAEGFPALRERVFSKLKGPEESEECKMQGYCETRYPGLLINMLYIEYGSLSEK